MNNKFYEIPVDWYKEFNKKFVDTGMSNDNFGNVNLANTKEGFERGNLFDDLYSPYKNYRYRELRASNKREELLFEILKYKFSMKELDLYLDTHPYDSGMI